MSAPDQRSPLARYRDQVTGLLEAGTPFADIEAQIGALDDLGENERSALWLFAFIKAAGPRPDTVPPRLSPSI